MQFTAWPEMIAWPYLILKGFLPYQDIGIAHNPLLVFLLAVYYKIFGVGILQLEVFTLLIIALTAFLIYRMTRKWYSILIYLVLCFAYQGWGLWFDLLLAPIALLLYKFVKEEKYLYAGVIFALGFLTKQTFIYFLIPVFFHLFKTKLVNLKPFFIGAISIFAIFALYLVTNGLAFYYYHWAVNFGVFYLPNASGQVLLPTFKQLLISLFPFSVLLFNSELILWAIVGMLGVYPRFELFHFQPALPFLTIALTEVVLNKSKKVKVLGIVILLFVAILLGRKVYREKDLEVRFYENDVQKIVNQLTTHSPQPKSLYVVNYWDNIYALTNTIPFKPLIPYIPWYLGYSNNAKLIIDGLQSDMPEALVVNDRESLNFEKLQTFIDRYYSCNIIEKKVEVCYKK